MPLKKRRWGKRKQHRAQSAFERGGYEEARLNAVLSYMRVLTNELQSALDRLGTPEGSSKIPEGPEEEVK